jgi:hypothetical protein
MSGWKSIATYAIGITAMLSLTAVATPAAAAVTTAPAPVRSVATVDGSRAAAAAACVFYTNGDYVHISTSEPQTASGHGWWTNKDCPTPLADVSVRLQLLKNGAWTDVAWSSKTVGPGGGAGSRATARVECKTIAWSQWRSVVDVDLVGLFDTTEVYTTAARGLYCGL